MKIIDYIPPDVVLDEAQLELINSLESIKSGRMKKSLFRLFSSSKIKGVYLHGAVGRGKTMILKAFYDSLPRNKAYFHYQTFMKEVHEEFHSYYDKGDKNPVDSICKSYSSKYDYIFIDELEVRDITDAMMIKRITESFVEDGIFICFSSNIIPDNLYRDGIQREQFLEFISLINQNFFIHNLCSLHDYRLTKIASEKQLILIGQENEGKFEEIFKSLTKKFDSKQIEIEVFGRKIMLEKSFGKSVYLTSDEILSENFSKNEFSEISKHFDAVFLNAKEINVDSSDKIIRLINFIDQIYLNKVLLVAIFSVNPDDIYVSGRYINEYKRSLSRISEMSSKNYIENSKYYIANG